MPALDRSVKVTCGKCGTSVTKKHLSRHKSRCSGGTLYCANCPNFCTKSWDDLNYHIAKNHATHPLKNTHKCKSCFKEFTGFIALRQHKTSEHGLQMKSAEFDVRNLFEVNNADLKEELQACQHFFVDSELEKGRHSVFSFAMSTFDNSLINWIYYSVVSNALPNLTLRLDLFPKTLKMDRVDFFMLTRTIRLWRGQNLCVTRRHYQPQREITENGYCWSLYTRESQYQMEVLQTDKSDSFCSASQRCTHGL